jgi:hypothetical protein
MAWEELPLVMSGLGVIDANEPGLGPGGSRVLSSSCLQGTSTVNYASRFVVSTGEFQILNTNKSKIEVGSRVTIQGHVDSIWNLTSAFDYWIGTRAPPTFSHVVQVKLQLANKFSLPI